MTSEAQAGHRYTPSGRSLISGCPHSQAWPRRPGARDLVERSSAPAKASAVVTAGGIAAEGAKFGLRAEGTVRVRLRVSSCPCRVLRAVLITP